MKYYIFRHQDKNVDLQTKKLKIGRIIKIFLVLVFIIISVNVVYQYNINGEFREFIDVKILRKEISNENTIQIDISSKTNPYVYTYYRCVTILDKNILEVYTSLPKPDYTIDVAISNPIYSDSSRFLCIAEKNGNKAYLISERNIVWQKDVEGQITKVSVNRNGYSAIVTSNTSYKTIITVYNPDGEELFKTYLPTTYAIDIEISKDNRYMAIAEINTSGTVMKSIVKIVSIENAKTDSDTAFVNTYTNEDKNVILNLKYQNKNNLIGLYNDRIVSMNESITEIKQIDQDINFADIELSDNIVTVTKQVSGILKTEYYANITNLTSLSDISYKLKGMPKTIHCNGDIIAINYGTEIEVINTSGWLVKRYKSMIQEIRDIKLTNDVIAVVYKDRVEVINL